MRRLAVFKTAAGSAMVRLLTVLVCAFGLGAVSAPPCARAGGTPATSPAVSYDLFAEDGPADARKLFVRIKARLPESGLKDLAASLAARSKPGTRLALVNVYLAGNAKAADPWAIVRIVEGAPQISVLGLRAEEEAVFRAEAQADTRDVVGHWLTSPPALPGKLTIVRGSGGRFVAEWHLRNGQKTSDEVAASRSSRGQRFDVIGGEGNYYVAAWDGSLQLGDATRTIAVAERLIVEPRPAAPVAAKAQSRTQSAALPTAAAAAEPTNPALPAAAGAGPSVAAPEPAASKARRTLKAAPARKSRSSVADLMGGALAR